MGGGEVGRRGHRSTPARVSLGSGRGEVCTFEVHVGIIECLKFRLVPVYASISSLVLARVWVLCFAICVISSVWLRLRVT